MNKNLLKWLLPMVVILSACSKDDVVPGAPQTAPAKGIYVLSEGSGSSESKLGFYNISTTAFTGDFFHQQNPAENIGTTANDAIIYGSKMYIVVNVSGKVVVTDAATSTFKKRIDLITGAPSRFPRYAIGYKNYVYVSASDNTVSVIDTTSLTVVKTITVGANPEGMAIVGNTLYVANSGGYNFTSGPDSTVSVVDLTSQSELKKIVIKTKNPQKIEANSAGDLYVTGYGNYTPSAPASVSVINSTTNTVKMELGSDFQYPFVRIFNDVAYFYNNYGGVGTSKLYNTITNTVVRAEFITDGTVITTPYGLNIDEQNGDVYITDAKDYTSSGVVTCFDKLGKKKFSFSTTPGVNPNKVLFIR